MGVIFLILFAITLFVLYIAVRRSWGNLITTGSVGVILSMLFVILFALTYKNTSTGQALLAGVVVGLGFAVGMIAIASFFRVNQPSAEVQLRSRRIQEENTSGSTVHHNQTPE